MDELQGFQVYVFRERNVVIVLLLKRCIQLGFKSWVSIVVFPSCNRDS